MRGILVAVIVLAGLFAVALLRTQAVLACPVQTTPYFPDTNFGVYAAYERLDQSSDGEKADALIAYYYIECSTADIGDGTSGTMRMIDQASLIMVSPFVSFDAPFLITQLQARP
mgnify:CR=1 FL=1|tara:strand:+ start:9688 stop:10029 length:342 start_codon:yes stop_codon:yes gene_type:complete